MWSFEETLCVREGWSRSLERATQAGLRKVRIFERPVIAYVLLCATLLASRAVDAGGTRLTVRFLREGDLLRVEIVDNRTDAPTQEDLPVSAPRADIVLHAWGCEPHSRTAGVTAWLRFLLHPPTGSKI